MSVSDIDAVARPAAAWALESPFDEAPASYVRVARQLQRNVEPPAGLRPLRTALVSTFTIDPLVPYLVVEGARRGLFVRPVVGPFGQLEEQLLDAASDIFSGDPEVVVIALRCEDCAARLGYGFLALTAEETHAVAEAFVARVEALVRAVRMRSRAHVLVWNQVLPQRLAAGLADPALAPSQAEIIAAINRRLADVCRAVSGASVFDVCRVAAEVGLSTWEDSKFRFLARAPLSAAAYVATAKRLARALRAVVVPPCKCLVLDLDNTLWGGVLGEDGPGGIALGEDYPGNVFLDFQRHLAAYRSRGVLLAIASKNNEAEVLDLFGRRSDMALRLDDFAAREIHWRDKAASLTAIARTLDLGTDALAFFDDNPVERDWVRTQLPGVHVIDVPADPSRYVAALDDSGAFDSLLVTTEDRARPQQYEERRQRRALAEQASSVEEFLRGLDMQVHLGWVGETTLPRVAQLLARTNQFNLTTHRHTAVDIERMIRDGSLAVWMRVTDRYGDCGLVGVALARPVDPATFELDTFLLSCRVLGRKVEGALLAALVRHARARGAAWLIGRFVPTARNSPAAGFLPAHGFQPRGDGTWRLELATARVTADVPFTCIDET